jgi:hypothetical protein
MMRHARRATLLVAFCLLISAATAYAECAWVLWEEFYTMSFRESPPRDSSEWRIVGAKPDEKDCANMAARAVTGRAELLRGIVEKSPKPNPDGFQSARKPRQSNWR